MKATKTLAGALALTMLASTAVSFQVSAADASVTLKGAKVEAEAGGAFSVDVSLADIPSTKINVMDFAVTYDNTVLNVDSVKIGKSADVDVSGDSTAADAPVFNTNIKDSEITVSWSTALGSASWIAEDGVILTISGTVKDDVKDGTVTPIDFAPVTRETYQGSGENNKSMVIGYVNGKDAASYTIKTEAGSVTVGKSGQTTTETTVTTSGEDTTETLLRQLLRPLPRPLHLRLRQPATARAARPAAVQLKAASCTATSTATAVWISQMLLC